MTEARKLRFPNGRDYPMQPLGLTELGWRIVEARERLAAGEAVRMSEFLRLVRDGVEDCLRAGGCDDAQVSEALRSVPLMLDGDAVPELMRFMIHGEVAGAGGGEADSG